jgi:hypothetical protein
MTAFEAGWWFYDFRCGIRVLALFDYLRYCIVIQTSNCIQLSIWAVTVNVQKKYLKKDTQTRQYAELRYVVFEFIMSTIFDTAAWSRTSRDCYWNLWITDSRKSLALDNSIIRARPCHFLTKMPPVPGGLQDCKWGGSFNWMYFHNEWEGHTFRFCAQWYYYVY